MPIEYPYILQTNSFVDYKNTFSMRCKNLEFSSRQKVLTWMYLHFNVSLDYSKAGPRIQSNDEFALF